MRMVNDLVVRGEPAEVDKLVGRSEADGGNERWRREPGVEKDLRLTGIGRLGVLCYSWRGEEGIPPASLLIYRTGPGELSSTSIIPTTRARLTDEEYNVLLANFEREVLRPLIGELKIEITYLPPREDRLELSISPAAFRKLNQFVMTAVDRRDLTTEDRANWKAFWRQVYADSSQPDDKELAHWLKDQGLKERKIDRLIAAKLVGQFLLHDDSRT